MRWILGVMVTVLGALLVSCASSPTKDAVASGRGASSTLNGLCTAVQTPIGLHQRVSDQGPVFADNEGRTLYRWRGKKGGWCKSVRDPIPTASTYQQLFLAAVPTCASQWPPALAQPGAQSTGDWTLVDRPEGTRQWAYQGDPLHTSYRDRLPGDVNGVADAPLFTDSDRPDFSVVQPPIIAPPGINIIWRRGLGLVATDEFGRLLYTGVKDLQQSTKSAEPLQTTAIGKRWDSVPASAMAVPVGAWTVVVDRDGSPYWAYRGQRLYRYFSDHEEADVGGYGIDGAEPLIVLPSARAPRGVTVRRTVRGPVYADAKGMTLYYFHCYGPNPSGRESGHDTALTCNNWSDDPGFSEMFCPGRERCAEMWRPLAAPASATAQGGVWSIAAIPDPTHYPLRWVPVDHEAAKTVGAIKVWTYRGVPVYTALGEQGPGELQGHDYFVVSGAIWRSVSALGPDITK